jgi:hypothetical protein
MIYNFKKDTVIKMQILSTLNNNIQAQTARIPRDTLQKVMHSVRQHVEFCMESSGAHLSDTIFKKVTM